MINAYKYEVAISFLEKDEQLALQIADRLRDRINVNVFVYSERQDELAGTDGVENFSRIFGEEARVVVILYREQWGETKWTRVEENAIRARGFNEGHEFVLLVKLDNSTQPPRWLPPTRIWVGYERYSIDGVASAIETRVQSLGGNVHSESAIDYAARLDRSISFASERRAWYESKRGLEEATQELNKLFSELKRLVNEIAEKTPRLHLSFDRGGQDVCVFKCKGLELQVIWTKRPADSLKDAHLWVLIIENRQRRSWSSEIDTIKHYNVQYIPDLDLGRQVVWRKVDEAERLCTSRQLADDLLKVFLDKATRSKSQDEMNL